LRAVSAAPAAELRASSAARAIGRTPDCSLTGPASCARRWAARMDSHNASNASPPGKTIANVHISTVPARSRFTALLDLGRRGCKFQTTPLFLLYGRSSPSFQ
jgi:hypothetical protein